jgi:hypothetical protein
MRKIETIEEKVLITKYTFRTTDGEIYDDYDSAQDHQMRIDGDRITCNECNGSKGENYWGEDGRLPKQWIVCRNCSGKGHLDKVTIFK